jgi:hypothetical protein
MTLPIAGPQYRRDTTISKRINKILSLRQEDKLKPATLLKPLSLLKKRRKSGNDDTDYYYRRYTTTITIISIDPIKTDLDSTLRS